MATSDFLAIAGAVGANVSTQSDYAALPAIATGYSSGIAKSAQINKTLRQASIMAAVLAQFIADQTGVNSVDDGTTATLLANLKASMPGRLLRTTVYANASVNTFIPLAASNTFRVTMIGSGGAGGGAPVTASNQIGAGNGGHSGAYAIGIFTKAQVGSSITVTVSPVGGGVAGGTGTNGGASSFGSLMSAAGGSGGAPFGPTSPPICSGNGSALATSSGGVINGSGGRGTIAFITSLTVGFSGSGANSPFGGGGGGINNTAGGSPAVGYGSGGGGAIALASNAAALAGGAGAIGFVMIEELA